MTEITPEAKVKACELVNADPSGLQDYEPAQIGASAGESRNSSLYALARLIQQVSDAAKLHPGAKHFAPFILPDPVDPLLIEARKLCAAADANKAYQFTEGQRDDYEPMTTVLAALRRGIELANAVRDNQANRP